MEIYDPSVSTTKAVAAAARLDSLQGKVLGLYDNTKEQADIILDAIGNALRERYGVAGVVVRRKEHYSKPATQALLDQIASEAHVAIAAVGG